MTRLLSVTHSLRRSRSPGAAGTTFAGADSEIEEGIEELKNSRAERFTIKQLEKTRKSLETKLKKLAGRFPQGRCGYL
jgi:acetylornithine/succinyldiaminopimelate/putrescine aminotransferase